MYLSNFICNKYWKIKHKNVLSAYNSYIQRSKLPLNEIHNYQIAKLSSVLTELLPNVPRYKDIKIDFKKFNYLEFQKIPLLTKDFIRHNTKLLINPNARVQEDKIIKNTSGGSTGAPVTFYQTMDQKGHGAAAYFYANWINGVKYYERSLDLWGAQRDMYHTERWSFREKIKEILTNKKSLNTFVMNQSIIESYINEMNKWKPLLIKAYVHSIYEISKFVNQNKLKISFTPIIHTTTGPLYPEMRLEIKKAFNNAHVFSFYGSREVSAIATESIDEKSMEVLYDNVFVEILDETGLPVEYGKEGEIVVTTLNNNYMPLIRYKIGDRAIKGDEINFGTLTIDHLSGRTLGVIHKKDGTYIDGQFFTTLFFNNKGIQQFQLVQKDTDLLELNIIKGKDFSIEGLNNIILRIQSELPLTRINVIFTEHINLTSTGKIMYVYSELNQ